MLDDPFGFDLMGDDAEVETEDMQNTLQEAHQATDTELEISASVHVIEAETNVPATESTITDETETEKNQSISSR